MVKKKDRYKKHIGKFPVNSRITVDYTKKKPSVKFGYPSKDGESTYRTIACAIPSMIIIAILAYIIMLSSAIPIHDTPEYCNVSEGRGNWTNFFTGENYSYFQGINTECLINNKSYNITLDFQSGSKVLWFYETQPTFYSPVDLKGDLLPVGPMLFLVLLFFPLCKVFAWIYKNTKLGNKWFPEINKVFGDSKFSAIFKDCPKTKQIELPLFKNIYMDYNAEGEFGKYLERVEIREHPFNELTTKGISRKQKRINKKNKKRNIKKIKNIWLWKATFFFSKQPKKGQLEIRWT